MLRVLDNVCYNDDFIYCLSASISRYTIYFYQIIQKIFADRVKSNLNKKFLMKNWHSTVKRGEQTRIIMYF